MSVRLTVIGLSVVFCAAAGAQGPEPSTQDALSETNATADTWQLNLEASKFPGAKPRFDLPRQPLDDGEFLIGLPYEENVQGDPGFVFVPSAAPPQREWEPMRRYPKIPETNRSYEYTAKFDSEDGEFVVDVRRTESRDGTALTLIADLTTPRGQVNSFVLVFNRQ